MAEMIIDNSLTDYSETIEFNNSNFDKENFYDWVEENLAENGVYEFDGEIADDVYLIQIPDDEPDWKGNFNEIVKKVKKYLVQ